MDFDDTPEEAAFRARAREWLAANAIPKGSPEDFSAGHFSGNIDGDEYIKRCRWWQGQLYEGGWAGISWPKEYGGRGASLIQQLIWFEEYGRLGLPGIDACFVGLSHAGPTLMARATEEQKGFHLPKILRGDVVWCQGFSEPGAGSDLASLQTRAEVDGDELVVTGQKIWTSFADVADWQELLVRTDRHVPKHRGITWVICDIHTPGIEVRPIETMDHDHEFCEVFYDEVRVPLANVVGDLNDGWSVAMSTLAFERGTAFTLSQVRLARIVEDLIDEAKSRTGPDGRRPAIADDELAQRIYRLALDVIGPDALHFISRWAPGGWSGNYLYSYAVSIGGGTSEIQRNIIGERVLGLPR